METRLVNPEVGTGEEQQPWHQEHHILPNPVVPTVVPALSTQQGVAQAEVEPKGQKQGVGRGVPARTSPAPQAPAQPTQPVLQEKPEELPATIALGTQEQNKTDLLSLLSPLERSECQNINQDHKQSQVHEEEIDNVQCDQEMEMEPEPSSIPEVDLKGDVPSVVEGLGRGVPARSSPAPRVPAQPITTQLVEGEPGEPHKS